MICGFCEAELNFGRSECPECGTRYEYPDGQPVLIPNCRPGWIPREQASPGYAAAKEWALVLAVPILLAVSDVPVPALGMPC